VLKYAEADPDLIVAGREMQVDAVLVGRIQRADDRIRITVQLVRTSDGAPLWADRFDDYFTNIFAVQDAISERMAEALRVRLTNDEEQRIAKRHTESVEAYQLYLQGRYLREKGTPESIKKAVEYFGQALAKDPDYPLAHASLAAANLDLSGYGVDVAATRARARAEAERALSLDRDLAEGYLVRASIESIVDWNFAAAERDLRRAVELSPRNADAHQWYSVLLTSLGRHDDALREIEAARQLDPVSVSVNGDYVSALVAARRVDDAIALAKTAVELDPRSLRAHRELAGAYIAKGMYAEAIDECEREVDLGGLPSKPALLGFAYARAGRRAEAERLLDERRRDLGRAGVTNFGIALIYAGLDDKEQTLTWLERAVEAHENPVVLLAVDPYWDGVRADPRFAALVRRVGLTR
jgi:tetratricopeptide (TPR) repeat protein